MLKASRNLSPAAELERRAARAEFLAGQPSTAHEPLLFAALLYRVQSEFAAAIDDAQNAREFTGRLDGDVDRLLPLSDGVICAAAEHGPEQLAIDARKRLREERPIATARLLAYWNGDSSAREDYLSRALLRPYGEVLRAHGVMPDRLHHQGRCPFCGGGPWISSLITMGDSEGALRLLGCALCGNEWNFNRVCCPSCHEEDPAKLPVYQSDAHPLVRIESCETCRRYVKSIDLTKDARPVPEIDELLSLSMDLWAIDEGFTRIEPGLAGI
jgi:formate dehydrogenase accessory protein FdhE